MANLTNSAKLIEEMKKKVDSSSLATVATSWSYTDLSNKPTIPTVNDSTITVQKNGTDVDSFTTNTSSAKSINIQLAKADVWLWNVDNTSDANKPISNATQTALNAKANTADVYTKAEVDSAISSSISSAYKYKGSVANQAALPSTGNTEGDVWNTEDTGMNYAWTGTAWDALWTTVDMSNYLAKNNTTAFTPTGDYNPATKKYVDDNITTKVFTLPSDLTSAEALAVAQNAYDWYNAWNYPVIYREQAQRYYSIWRIQSTKITFYQTQTIFSSSSIEIVWYSSISQDKMVFTLSSWTVTEITASTDGKSVLATWVDYATPYTPEYDWSPATKKYVDDNKWTKVEVVTQSQYDALTPINGTLYAIKSSS